MYLRLYPKYINNSYDTGALKKIDKEIEQLQIKVDSFVTAYTDNSSFKDYYYVTNEKYHQYLSIAYKDVSISKKELVIFDELPKGSQKWVHIIFLLDNGTEYDGFIPLSNYMIWSRDNSLDNSEKITEDSYQYKTVNIITTKFDVTYVDNSYVTLHYYEQKETYENYKDGNKLIAMSPSKVKKQFYKNSNLHYEDIDYITLFKCKNTRGSKLCDDYSGTPLREVDIKHSDENYNWYLKPENNWEIVKNRKNQIIYGSNEIGDEIDVITNGMELIQKDQITHNIEVMDLDGLNFYYKRSEEDYLIYDSGENMNVIKEKITELQKERESIINRDKTTYFDFPIDNDYKFSFSDSIEIGEEIKSSVNNLLFGLPDTVTKVDNAIRSLNFREQEAFHQFGAPTLRTQTTKSDIKIKPIKGTIETSTVSGIMRFLRLLYMSSPKISGASDNLFIKFDKESEEDIISYLQSIQNVINSSRKLDSTIREDKLYYEGNSYKDAFGIITNYITEYSAKGANYAKAVTANLLDRDEKTNDEWMFKGNSGIGYTADYVDFALYEISDDKEYFLFDSRNTFDYQTPIDLLLNNNDKFASLAIPVVAGTAIGGTAGKVVGGVGVLAGVGSMIYKSMRSEDKNKDEVISESNFIIKDIKFDFSPTSGMVKKDFSFPTYIKYEINLETKKAPILNDILRMSLLHQMIISEKQRDIVEEAEGTVEENVKKTVEEVKAEVENEVNNN